MAVTEKELNDFQDFSSRKLANGGAESISELVRLREESRAHRESVAALRESHEDAEQGRVFSAEDVFSEARRILGSSR